MFSGRYDWSWSGAAVATGATGTAEVGGDSGNRPIPTSNNTDSPMNNNSYRNLIKVLLIIIFVSPFQTLNNLKVTVMPSDSPFVF